MKINILYGSSCVGKSTYMQNMEKENLTKIEIDDCEYWRFPEHRWEYLSLKYLVNQITTLKHNSNVVVTCGGLPLPDNEVYKKLEKTHNVNFYHTLILCKNQEEYKNRIIKRSRQNIMDYLLENHKWRESKKELYNEVIII